MSTNNDTLKSDLLKYRIELTDTLSQLVEKCNNSFNTIAEWGGGPAGVKGDDGDQGIPTKPKVPIHVWIEGEEYITEHEVFNENYTLEVKNENELEDPKYQSGHLIMLKNAHIYILEEDKTNNFKLQPVFLLTLQTYDPDTIVNGRQAYVHFAYADSSDGSEGFITDNNLRGESTNNGGVATFNLRRVSTDIASTTAEEYGNSANTEKAYLGVYSDNSPLSSNNHKAYTWIKVQGGVGATGAQGPQGPKGDPGEKGDSFTGQPYTIDLEGDMSTISIDINRTRLYDGDYCECIVHAYYGNKNVQIYYNNVSINLPEDYTYSNAQKTDIVLASDSSVKVGRIAKSMSDKNSNDTVITFTPDKDFIFPHKSIALTIHINATIYDENDKNTYVFERDVVWTIRGIESSFELELIPQHRTIKLNESGEYLPNKLFVDVYKVENGERSLFDFSKNTSFTLLYKDYNSENWNTYPYNDGVNIVENTSCVEFKVVRYNGTANEEIWDYEDVWVVADGKSVHYYHADLGNTESIMILTTGEKINYGTESDPKNCAELKNSDGYSITFNPKFYDGTEEIAVTGVSIGQNSGEEYYTNETFVRNFDTNTYTLTITRVPYGVDVIPMTFVVTADCPIYDENGDVKEYITKSDTVSFNVYISTLSNIYTLVPTVSSYNTSTGKNGDEIGCAVYKNNSIINVTDLNQNGLTLKYIVHDNDVNNKVEYQYTEPLIYGKDDDVVNNSFAAKDVAIEFILYYRNKEVVRSTVPLIKDGIDGRDGDSWQYIFCRSAKYPFINTGISNPSTWTDDKPTDSDNELLGNNGVVDNDWYDDHKGVNSELKYEYQSYRKWDKNNKCWGKYGDPTLYSNYSESGSGYSALLSNPVAVIPVGDDDWSVNESNSNQIDSTLVYLYNNTSDMSSNDTVSISLPENNIYVQKGNFTTTKENGINKVIFTPAVGDSIFDFGSNAQYKLPITLTYTLDKDNDNDGNPDSFSTTINWTLSPIKGLHDVEVFVDKRVVNTSISDTHQLKVGYYLISSNNFKQFISNPIVGNLKGYKIILTDDIEDLSSDAISNWQNATYNFVSNGNNRNCYVVLVDAEGNKLDYAVVTTINDGKNGASAMHLELTQDYINLPCSADGRLVHPDYDTDVNPIASQMKLYDGDTLVEDYDNMSYSFKVNGELVTNNISYESNGKFAIQKSIINGKTNIECIATYKGTSYYKTLSIILDHTPYELELNKSVLTRDVNLGKIIDEKIVVCVKYWMDGMWKYTNSGIVKATTINENNDIVFGNAVGEKYERTLSINTSTGLMYNTSDIEVKISYYKDNSSTNPITFETIGIVNSGKNGEKGSAPSCTQVEILGYSDKELSIDAEISDSKENCWRSNIELLNLTVGQPIYILNKYTWSDGTTTKGITVTLAGTQGNDGKSRVLFYLGSFYEGTDDNKETPTLTGSTITGKLDDYRCDYYIDVNGQAWMRIGNKESAIGLSTGNNTGEDKNYWKASEKVGFLQAGAITADMINTGSITSDSALVTALFAQNVEASNLIIKASNIDGEIEADQILNGTISATKISDGAIITSKIAANAITANEIAAEAITADKIAAHTITANEIEIGLIPDDLDIDWLKNAFSDGSTTISNGLILSSFIAVNGNNGPESGLNSSTKIKSGRDDYDDKKLVFFAGSNGLKTSSGGSTNITSNSTEGYTSNAKIEFFSDGSGYVAGDRFKWDETGKATVQNLTIKNSILDGSFRSPFRQVETGWGGSWSEGNYNPDTQEIYDNLYCDYGGYYLPWTWTTDNIGRHITLVNNRGGNKITDYGTNHIDAEDGYYFFEDGVARKRLDFSNEILELIGYGNDDQFYGWIVNKRDNIMTLKKYGHNLKCLCFGTVTFSSSSSASISSLKTFDGTSTSTSYHISQRFSIVSDTNSCTITMPQCWFRDAASDSLHVVLTPVYNTRIPQVALGDIGDNSFKVHVDKCPASFNFMLYNKNDWMSFSNEFAYKKIVYVEKTTNYSGATLSYKKGDTDASLKFKTNASNGLKVEYVEGDNGWVYWELNKSGSEYILYLQTTVKNTQDERQCKIKITYSSLTDSETTSSGVTYSHTILLTQQSMYTDNGGGSSGGYGS